MQQLLQAPAATDGEVMHLIDRYHLHGRGIGWVDAHLLARTLLAADAQLWTRDRHLHAVAEELGMAMPEVTH